MQGIRQTIFWFAFITTAVSFSVSAQDKAFPNYEQMLYDLGALPVAKLTKPYWTNGHPGQVYSKGERLDVDGWLPPYWAPSHLTDAEKARYGIPKKPLSYEQYVALLDVETYKRTHDPQLLLVMRFTLENMRYPRLKLKREDFLRIFEARIGLEKWAVRLAKGQLSSDDSMRLLRTYGDETLFDVLPSPEPADKAYVAFLEEQVNAATWSIHSRQAACKLLFALDEKTYRTPYRDFMLGNVKSATYWWDRANLYAALIQLKDEESWKAVRDALIHDPITECRESILYRLKEQGEVASAIDAVLVVVNGKSDPHHAVMPSRSVDQWRGRLSEYLTWAKSIQTLDALTATKVDDAIEKLDRNPSFDAFPSPP